MGIWQKIPQKTLLRQYSVIMSVPTFVQYIREAFFEQHSSTRKAGGRESLLGNSQHSQVANSETKPRWSGNTEALPAHSILQAGLACPSDILSLIPAPAFLTLMVGDGQNADATQSEPDYHNALHCSVPCPLSPSTNPVLRLHPGDQNCLNKDPPHPSEYRRSNADSLLRNSQVMTLLCFKVIFIDLNTSYLCPKIQILFNTNTN